MSGQQQQQTPVYEKLERTKSTRLQNSGLKRDRANVSDALAFTSPSAEGNNHVCSALEHNCYRQSSRIPPLSFVFPGRWRSRATSYRKSENNSHYCSRVQQTRLEWSATACTHRYIKNLVLGTWCLITLSWIMENPWSYDVELALLSLKLLHIHS